MIIAIIIVGLVALVSAYAFGYTFKLLNRYRFAADQKIIEAMDATANAKLAQEEAIRLREHVIILENSLETARAEYLKLAEANSRLSERIRYAEEDRQRLAKESELRFKELASSIMTEHSINFKEQNEERLTAILAPLKENIEQFKKSINESYSNEARERFSLQEKIKELMELNQSIGREAKELATALRYDTGKQGIWGEMILESILEKSGLQKGREYTIQQTRDESGQTLKNEENKRLRPDVVIHYPDGRHVVIDSKVSLTDYVKLLNCNNDDELKEYTRRHIESVRSHIKELDKKSYQDYVGGGQADFVMMFIPNEGAYVTAMQACDSLWQEAYNKHVLIVSPTHLISALKLIQQLWRHHKIANNYLEIAQTGGAMYDKFVGFIGDMQGICKSIENSRDAYEKAMNKLCEGRGNLVGRAEKLRKLGAKVSKNMPDTILLEDGNDSEND